MNSQEEKDGMNIEKCQDCNGCNGCLGCLGGSSIPVSELDCRSDNYRFWVVVALLFWLDIVVSVICGKITYFLSISGGLIK